MTIPDSNKNAITSASAAATDHPVATVPSAPAAQNIEGRSVEAEPLPNDGSTPEANDKKDCCLVRGCSACFACALDLFIDLNGPVMPDNVRVDPESFVSSTDYGGKEKIGGHIITSERTMASK